MIAVINEIIRRIGKKMKNNKIENRRNSRVRIGKAMHFKDFLPYLIDFVTRDTKIWVSITKAKKKKVKEEKEQKLISALS